MEDRYGWRILLYDLEAMQKAYLKTKHGMKSRVTRGTAEAFKENILSSQSQAVSTLRVPGYTVSFPPLTAKFDMKTWARRKVGIGYENAFTAVLAVDPLVTLLELAKFSFVADWFVNLGDAVRAYSPFGAGSVVWYWCTTEVETRNTYTVWDHIPSSYYDRACPPVAGSVTLGRRLRTRVPLNWDDHKFAIRWYNDLDLLKVVDMISVLRGIGRPFAPWLRA
jgi:hypothetical protein